ncbi:MAG: phosphoglycerate dehydrogenase [Gammaproteobacteria bacterium]|jgi:D-3-phosphoglycerate dehydrogenase
MYKIKTFNNISDKGLSRLPPSDYDINPDHDRPDAIILRSQKLHEYPIPDSLLAVGRAGAGTNNVPVVKMSEHGIPVFNAPGANANAVKELVIAGMLLACRNICQAWDYARNVEGTAEQQNRAVEDGKKRYVGYELPGRTLGVVGLGAIGVYVANAAVALGMRVIGFDPTITVKSAWKMSAEVQEMPSIDELVKQADFVTFHVPLLDSTKNLLNVQRIANMKAGAVVLNFARDGIVDDDAVLKALNDGTLGAYVSDFPAENLKGSSKVITLPHLGASTVEAEENCAIMVADQVRDFLENGNIHNSVNFPEIRLARIGEVRLAIANQNRPDMVGQISHVLGQAGVNIQHMRNESRGELAYTLMDLDKATDQSTLSAIKAIDGVLSVRQI